MKEKVRTGVEEQELHINYYPVEMGKNCEIYTTIPWMMNRLEKLVEKYPDKCRLVKDDKYSYTASIPFKLVQPRNPKILTEEEKQAVRERFAASRRTSGGTTANPQTPDGGT